MSTRPEGVHDSPAPSGGDSVLVRIGSKYQTTVPSVADGDSVYLLVDAAGRVIVVGAAGDGTAVAGAPVRIAGSDGTLTQDILTDTGGRLITESRLVATTYFTINATGTVGTASASAKVLYGIEASNPNTVDSFLQIWDAASANITIGVTAPKASYLIPGGQSGTARGGFSRSYPHGMNFATAVMFASSTTPTGSSAPGTGLSLNVEMS